MPVWMDLEGIVYLPFEDLHLERRIGLKWRTTQDSQLVDNFRLFAVNHNWEV